MGYSTGEEVYTMGIVLKESSSLPKVRTLATGISDATLSTAQQGIYHQLEIDEYEKNYQDCNPHGAFARYYEKHAGKEGSGGKMDSQLVQHVGFHHHNLILEPPPGQFDIIFCRNVMIYFDTNAKLKLLEKFHEHLHEGGYLIIGFYDALVQLIDKSKYKFTDLDAKIFQKI
ncbi:MAG: CheR family methyltransferase [Bacteroidota bacterium]